MGGSSVPLVSGLAKLSNDGQRRGSGGRRKGRKKQDQKGTCGKRQSERGEGKNGWHNERVLKKAGQEENETDRIIMGCLKEMDGVIGRWRIGCSCIVLEREGW